MKNFARQFWHVKPVVLLCGFVVLGLFPLLGCDLLLSALSGNTVTVSLVNDSDFDVTVSLYISDEQLIPSFLITEQGDRSVFTVSAGESFTFFRTCDDLQAIIIDDADLLVISGLGPEANSSILRDGDDFSCGDSIIFTFDHSAAILDFDVTSSVFGF